MDGMTDTDADHPAVDGGDRAGLDKEALYHRLKAWFRVDRDASSRWREEARIDFDMVSGHQWAPGDKAALDAAGRPAITFNRCLPIIKAVAGSEVNSRLDIQYMPREIGDAALNELLTEGSRYLADEAEAEDEESDAFIDLAICGMGWVEMRLDYETNPDGAYVEDRVNPLEMIWDASATKRNLSDARRLFRAKSMDRAEAEAMFPDADPDDLDAAWAEDRDGDGPHHQIQPGQRRSDRPGASDEGTARVTIVEACWWERKRVAIVTDPTTGQATEMDEKRAAILERRAAALGMTVQVARRTKRVYRRAFLGGVILAETDSPAGDRFHYACMTGDRDQNRNSWFGIVRPMRDPQRFANKWLSQTMDMLNRQAKGGVFMETGAVPDQAQFEESYAKPGGVTWLADGTLASGRMKEKPLPVLPSGHYQLMEFAIMSIRDSSGVNLELMGQKQQEQAGVLEYQRKQAAMTMLASLFDALRRARKHIGRVRLYMIQNFLSDGRLVRIMGDGVTRVVPLLRDKTAGDYDVVIDDAPASPNQQQVVWQTFTSVLPIIKDMITPQVLLEVLPYSPFPASFVAKMRELLAEAPADPQAEAQQQVAMRTALAKIEDLTAGANLKNAKAGREAGLTKHDEIDGFAKVAALAAPPEPSATAFAA
ncbi:Phage P22-like portal protein [Methylobacterium gossipiicola]|uniref:Phage P22-like portal protein n=2 Tax=Methylobacterium gossipiicola TaxID=582675 RepID=A0A1I2TNZ8_9HYPH|nr:Phage P22-like portal protein [Methylobacterium gossipiicola]